MTLPALTAMLGARSSWSPESLSGLVAWWDADTAGSFTFGSGVDVASWASRVGSYSLGQSTASKRPSRSATIGGRSAVQFGADDALSVASFDMGAGKKVSLWIVCAVPSWSDRILVEHSANYNLNPGGFICFRESSNSTFFSRNLPGGYYQSWRTSGTLTTIAKSFIGTIDGTLSTNQGSGWLNGDPSGTRPHTQNASMSNRNDTLYVGARAGTSLYSAATIGEFGLSTAIFSPSEIAALNAYLAAKWSL